MATTSRNAVRIALLLCASALMAFALACSGDGKSSEGDSSSSAATKTAGAAASKQVNLTVEMKDNVFEPTKFEVAAGTTVTFKYANTGLAVHNMIVQSGDIEGKTFQSPPSVNPGDKGEFTATFTKPGTIKFICAYHMPGMGGEITVK
jgi:plastocyanin